MTVYPIHIALVIVVIIVCAIPIGKFILYKTRMRKQTGPMKVKTETGAVFLIGPQSPKSVYRFFAARHGKVRGVFIAGVPPTGIQVKIYGAGKLVKSSYNGVKHIRVVSPVIQTGCGCVYTPEGENFYEMTDFVENITYLSPEQFKKEKIRMSNFLD